MDQQSNSSLYGALHQKKISQSTGGSMGVDVLSSKQMPYDCLYQLKIHLLHISPQIYRRLIVKGDTTILQLHHIVQIVMGWDNWHLHYFRIFGRDYGIDYPGGEQFLGIPEITRLGDFILQVHDTFHYIYDYFDHWVHQIRVEAIPPAQENYLHPVCTADKRACPPEELGGPAVYDRWMQAATRLGLRMAGYGSGTTKGGGESTGG